MSSIFFWRKKRGEEKETIVPAQLLADGELGSKENLSPATLPTRSSRKGIRSHFTSAKFD